MYVPGYGHVRDEILTCLHEKLLGKYCGITKKDFPKWQGWKIIKEYKDCGVLVKDICDDSLQILVYNHYCLERIKKMCRNETPAKVQQLDF